MRIIAGKFRGRKIVSPKGSAVRPTSDRVKEALFQMLGALCEGASILDLYAGSGNLGLEAMSRGAASCCFVEKVPGFCGVVRRNCEALGLIDRVSILRKDSVRGISYLHGRGELFDIVLADPPYLTAGGESEAKKILSALDRYDIFARRVTVVVEHYKGDEIELGLERLVPEKRKRYGDTMLSFYNKRNRR